MTIPNGYSQINTFTVYSEYDDKNILEITDMREVIPNEYNNEVILEETASEYLTFDMPRYFDGVDLSTKDIRVHYWREDTKETGGGYTACVNGLRSSTRVRFGWIVDAGATAEAGTLYYQIEAIGVNSKKETYIFKSKTAELTVLDAIKSGDGSPAPAPSWYAELLARMQDYMTQAAAYRDEAKERALQAWTRQDEVSGKYYTLGISGGVPYFEEVDPTA